MVDVIGDIADVVRKRGGSDLHVHADRPALMRVGRLLEKMRETVSSEGIELFVKSLDHDDQDTLSSSGAVTTIIPSLGVRAHVYRENNSHRVHLRILDREAPRHEKLGRPPQVLSWLERAGLILVTGPRRVGKSSEIAALTAKVLDSGHRTVLEIGRPPEFRYDEQDSFVARVHIGRDAKTFGSAIRESLDGDIDVIVVQQVVDQDSADALFKAMEAGILVIAGFHATDTLQAIDRLIGHFSHDTANARTRLANALIGVMNLRLVMDRDNKSLPVTEVLTMNDHTRPLLIAGEMVKLREEMKKREDGMQTLEQDISALVRSSVVTRQEALLVGTNYRDEIESA